MRQIAFLVMPFGRKHTGLRRAGVPSEVDFDALWDKVYEPLLTDLGYRAVRADRDAGALIVSQMVQRLVLADLIVADVTLANANVYYEVGVRHAAGPVGCVLTSAEWAEPVFDLAQMRQVRYPLGDGGIDDATAAAARQALGANLESLSRGRSPVFDAVPGYPGNEDPSRLSAFEDFAESGRQRGARAAPAAA